MSSQEGIQYRTDINLKRDVFHSETDAVMSSGRMHKVNVASASYNVSGRNVNIAAVYRDAKFKKAVDRLFGDIDQIFYRSSMADHGPEVVVFVNGIGKITKLHYNGHAIKTNSDVFSRRQDARIPESRNSARKRIITYDNHRLVLARLFPKEANKKSRKRGEEPDYTIPIGDFHKDMIMATADITMYTWGNIVGYGDSAIWYIGPHGVSKSESSNNAVDNGAVLMGDDIIGIGPAGESFGTNYRAIYSQKEWFKKDGIDPEKFDPEHDYDKHNPETSPKYADCFVENKETPYRHLKLDVLPKKIFLKKREVKDIGEIFDPSPVRTDTIIFYLPYLPNYYNMWFKNKDEGDSASYQMPSQRQVLDAHQHLEGFGSAKIQFHKKTAQESADHVSEHFKVTSPIDPTRNETIVNLKRHFTDDQLFDTIGNWILKHSEEYCCGDLGKDNSWMELYVRDAIRGAERVYMIGKRTPPRPSPRLSQTIVETVAQGNVMRRFEDIEE